MFSKHETVEVESYCGYCGERLPTLGEGMTGVCPSCKKRFARVLDPAHVSGSAHVEGPASGPDRDEGDGAGDGLGRGKKSARKKGHNRRDRFESKVESGAKACTDAIRSQWERYKRFVRFDRDLRNDPTCGVKPAPEGKEPPWELKVEGRRGNHYFLSTEPVAVYKDPVLAGLLSACLPGAGQFYNLQFFKGILILLTSWLVVPYFIGIIDAFFSARRLNRFETAYAGWSE